MDQLTPNFLTRLIAELIGENENYTPKDKIVIAIVQTLDPKEINYHIENNVIWKRREWLVCIERKRIEQEKLRKEKEDFEKRKSVFFAIRSKLMQEMGLGKDIANAITLKILTTRSESLANQFGTTLEGVPFGRKFHIIEGEDMYEI